MATKERYIITGISVQLTVLQEKKGNSYSPSFPSWMKNLFFFLFFFSVFSGKLRYALFLISQYIWCSAEVGQFQL